MTAGAIITIVMLALVFIILMRTNLPSDIVYLSAVMFLLLFGAIDTETALSGFSSSAVVRVGVLSVVTAGLYWSGVLKWATKNLLNEPRNYLHALIRMTLPAAFFAALVTDNSVVTTFSKVMKQWSKLLNVALSRLLLPLAYIAQMGGVFTIISSASAVIVVGMYADDNPGQSIGFFDVTPSALICFAVMVGAILLLRRLLPIRTAPEDEFGRTTEYTVEMLVPSDCRSIGMTVSEAGLGRMKGGHLIEIVRFDREVITPVSPDEFIMGGDRLIYTGKIPLIEQLKKSHGLVASNHHVFSVANEDSSNRCVRAAMVKFNSRLVGRTILDSRFEQKNDLVVIALSRGGRRFDDSPRHIRIEGGDMLLIEMSSKDKHLEHRLRHDLVWTEVEDLITVSPKTAVSSLVVLGMMVIVALGLVPVLQAAMLAAFSMLVFRCCSIRQAHESIRWEALMTFAASIVFSKAIEQNGLADMLAGFIIDTGGGNSLAIVALLAATILLATEIINNAAVAALFYPIVQETAIQTGLPAAPLCYLLMICSVMAFATPIGSSVNIAVYGQGGYKVSDYLRIGIPLKIVSFVTVTLTIYLLYIR